ncbi:hypothetical protein [Pseudoduganella buxea]|uniref:Uncharacterized protein n=1 Tax=Pseudoduganella buxea TaxID=1949069 RepID=A0A6I3T9E7_9BURK|nr:hypothetical protein [Pseudoduganella buxea]MTV56287.1 hypothetical protein [Pseudoduganella buxea]GGC20026.1 hypothetical protein GCM10011572_46760 [Pseudoduganella buxea]
MSTTHTQSAVSDTAPVNAAARLTAWRGWDRGLVIMNALTTALFGQIESGRIAVADSQLRRDLVATLFGLNTALHDITAQFKAHSDKPDAIAIDAPGADQWPAATGQADLGSFSSAFDTIGAALDGLHRQVGTDWPEHPDAETIQTAIAGLIDAKDDVIAVIRQILSQQGA